MAHKKKMTLMQLTVLVSVNMMGSGIIMLPANMAKVGAISLLSWGSHGCGLHGDRLRIRTSRTFQSETGGHVGLRRRSSRKRRLLHDVLSLLFLAGDWKCGHRNLRSGISRDIFPLAVRYADRDMRRGNRSALVDNGGQLRGPSV